MNSRQGVAGSRSEASIRDTKHQFCIFARPDFKRKRIVVLQKARFHDCQHRKELLRADTT